MLGMKKKYDSNEAKTLVFERLSSYRQSTRDYPYLSDESNVDIAISKASKALIAGGDLKEKDYHLILDIFAKIDANLSPENDYLLSALFGQIEDVVSSTSMREINQAKASINSISGKILSLTKKEAEISATLVEYISEYGPKDPRVIVLSGEYKNIKRQLDSEAEILQDYVDFDVSSSIVKQRQRYAKVHSEMGKATGIDSISYQQAAIEEEVERRIYEKTKAQFAATDARFGKKSFLGGEDVFLDHPDLVDMMEKKAAEKEEEEKPFRKRQ